VILCHTWQTERIPLPPLVRAGRGRISPHRKHKRLTALLGILGMLRCLISLAR
jgi:hypothetical protein